MTYDPDLDRLIDLLLNLSDNNPIFDGFNTTDWLNTLDTLDQLANATIAILSVSIMRGEYRSQLIVNWFRISSGLYPVTRPVTHKTHME